AHRPVLGRRRLPDQAVRDPGAGGPAARADPARAPPGRFGGAQGRRPGARPGQHARHAQRHRAAALADRDEAAHHPDARVATRGQPPGDRARDLGQRAAGFRYPAQPSVQPAQDHRQAVRQAVAAHRAERGLPYRRYRPVADLILRDLAMPQGLPRKIRYAFVTQGLLLILAVVFGVGALTLVTRDALIRQRLLVEAEAFWAHHADSRAATPLPATRTIQGYFTSRGDRRAIPPYVASLPEGVNFIYRSHKAVLVERRPEGVLYLVLRTNAVDDLMWTSAGVMTLLGLLTALVITLLTYRKSRSIVLPVNRLAEEVSRWDPMHGDL